MAAVALVVAFAVAGCGAVAQVFQHLPDRPSTATALDPIVGIGGGNGPTGPYRAWIYRTSDSLFCIEVATTRSGGSSCGGDITALLGPGVSSGDEGVVVYGGTGLSTATNVIVTLADGTSTGGTLAAGGAVAPTALFYVVALPTGSQPIRIAIVDAGGAVLEQVPLH